MEAKRIKVMVFLKNPDGMWRFCKDTEVSREFDGSYTKLVSLLYATLTAGFIMGTEIRIEGHDTTTDPRLHDEYEALFTLWFRNEEKRDYHSEANRAARYTLEVLSRYYDK